MSARKLVWVGSTRRYHNNLQRKQTGSEQMTGILTSHSGEPKFHVTDITDGLVLIIVKASAGLIDVPGPARGLRHDYRRVVYRIGQK
ncbi:hypothetical protein J6590_012410 [Homalodisca vitripennis]|nr:hypothetical protein J6590_012410 [Homalodisca vitripennis]